MIGHGALTFAIGLFWCLCVVGFVIWFVIQRFIRRWIATRSFRGIGDHYNETR